MMMNTNALHLVQASPDGATRLSEGLREWWSTIHHHLLLVLLLHSMAARVQAPGGCTAHSGVAQQRGRAPS